MKVAVRLEVRVPLVFYVVVETDRYNEIVSFRELPSGIVTSRDLCKHMTDANFAKLAKLVENEGERRENRD